MVWNIVVTFSLSLKYYYIIISLPPSKFVLETNNQCHYANKIHIRLQQTLRWSSSVILNIRGFFLYIFSKACAAGKLEELHMAMTEAMFVYVFINKSYNSECKQVVPCTLIWLCKLSRWQKVLCVQESCGWALILYDSFLMQTCKFLVLEIILFNEAHVSLLVWRGKIPVIKATWTGLKSMQFGVTCTS